MMRRVKKSKIQKRQKIKETIIGLSLAISIGVAGSAGSYAYFSDRVNADNGIKITMGTLDVSIGDGFNQTEFEKSKEYTKTFDITNEGTLDEILTLKFENISSTENIDLSKVKYSLKIGNDIQVQCTLNELSTKGVKIGRLNSGKSISCEAILINDGVEKNYIKDDEIKFNLVVNGVQINDTSVQYGGVN